MNFDLNSLKCPKCQALDLEFTDNEIKCRDCGQAYPVQGGIPNLLVKPEARTKLEDIEYDSLHGINVETAKELYQIWAEVFEKYGLRSGKLLELGAGTGMLSYGLVESSPFDEIHISDISSHFLEILQGRLPRTSKPLYYYVCDGNFMPFRKDYFEIVVGRSILHHIIDYPTTLAEIYKVLKKDGIAVFTEPVREGHVIIAFFSGLLYEMQRSLGLNLFSEQEMKVLLSGTRTVNKHLLFTREQLEEKEDKYVFAIREMKDLGSQLGYSSTEFYNLESPLGSPPQWGYKAHFKKVMLRRGFSEEKIDSLDFLFSAFASTYGKAIPQELVTPTGFFIFQK